MDKSLLTTTRIAVFRRKEIRKIIHENEWWFSVVDVCKVLTDSIDAGAYWRKLKQRLIEEGSEVVTFCHGLKLKAPDGKKYNTDCANTEVIFRLIQSIPSPKAEPFKRWLARVGYEPPFSFTLSFPRKWESRVHYAQDILYLHISE